MTISCFLESSFDYSTSGFRSLGTTISRPFTSATPLKSPTPTLKEKSASSAKIHREMQDMESLSGTQARQIFSVSSRDEPVKIRRVERRLLETEAEDVRVGDVGLLVRELRRVVMALDERGGFLD